MERLKFLQKLPQKKQEVQKRYVTCLNFGKFQNHLGDLAL